jgi:hypothetical protein
MVVDEADLVLSYGYNKDIEELFLLLPNRSLQVFFCIQVEVESERHLDGFSERHAKSRAGCAKNPRASQAGQYQTQRRRNR